MSSTIIFQKAPDCFEKAAKKYNRTLQSLDEDIETIKAWFKTQPHLPEIMDDVLIRNFLLINKCSIERTKKKIDMYYTIRSLLPEVYDECNPRDYPIKDVFQRYMYYAPLPKTSPEGYRVYMVKLLPNINVKDLDHIKNIAMQVDVQEIRLFEDCFQGDIIVLDYEHVNLDFVLAFTPTLVAKIMATYQKVYSTPLKAVYAVNAPSYIMKLLPLVKMFMKQKVIDRIKVCPDTKILNEAFPKEMLPKDYGGDELSLKELTDMVCKKLDEYQWRFDALDKLRTNESLRPTKLNNDNFLGFYGNFKKMDVD